MVIFLIDTKYRYRKQGVIMAKSKVNLTGKTIFITGVAGFIGSNLAKRVMKDVKMLKIV